MKTIILSALTAVVLATSGHAATSGNALSTRAEPADVVIFERDKGIYGTAPVRGSRGVASLVDADSVLFPRERAVAIDGKVTVYSFDAQGASAASSFPRR